jgi:hypothetical protein
MGSRRIANDVQKIAPFVDEGWVIVSSEGKITSKHDFLQVIKSGDLVHTRMEFEDVHVKIYGSTGVVVSRGTNAEPLRACL